MPLLGPGTWSVVVRNATFDGKNEVPQLVVYFEDEMGEGINWYSSLGFLKNGEFSEKGHKFAMDQLRSLGWDAEARHHRYEELGAENSPLIGVACEIVVQDETYEGKTRTKVKWINDPNRPRAGAERMEPDAAKSWADRLRGALGKSAPAGRPNPAGRPKPAAPANAAAPTSAPAKATDGENFDDIPF